MQKLQNYWFIDNTTSGLHRVRRPEQAFTLERMGKGHYELKMALLDSTPFVNAAKAEREKNGQNVSDDFIEIVEAICTIGENNNPKKKTNKKSSPFIYNYHRGMSKIYDELKPKSYNVYSCEVNFNCFERSLNDIVLASEFHHIKKPIKNPYYCNDGNYNYQYENPDVLGQFAWRDRRKDFEVMNKFVREMRANKRVYEACSKRFIMRLASPADKLIWMTGYATRRAAAKLMDENMPAIVNPTKNMAKTGYRTLAEFKKSHGISCSIRITDILGDPASLFNSIEQETYDPVEKCARYDEEGAKKYAAWLDQMSFNPKNQMG